MFLVQRANRDFTKRMAMVENCVCTLTTCRCCISLLETSYVGVAHKSRVLTRAHGIIGFRRILSVLCCACGTGCLPAVLQTFWDTFCTTGLSLPSITVMDVTHGRIAVFTYSIATGWGKICVAAQRFARGAFFIYGYDDWKAGSIVLYCTVMLSLQAR